MGRGDRALTRLGLIALAFGALLLAPVPGAAGALTGRVVFRGDVPAQPPIDVVKDHEACGTSMPSEVLVVSSKNRGVKHTVVYVEGLATAAAAEGREATLENQRCRFVPHVLAVQVGTELSVRNADPVLHNLRAWLEGEARRAVFNVVQPTQGQVTTRTIKRSGVITLTCDTHVHMSGYLLAFDHPYFAVTNDDGQFTIEGIPPGTYRISAWHEGWTVVGRTPVGRRPIWDAPRVVTREVTVPHTGDARVLFEIGSTP